MMWPNSGFLGRFPASAAARFTKNYALACFDRAEKPQESGRADDYVRCQYRRGYQPDARAAAAVGRRPDLCAVSGGRKQAADRSGYVVADDRRSVDIGPSRRARDRWLF